MSVHLYENKSHGSLAIGSHWVQIVTADQSGHADLILRLANIYFVGSLVLRPKHFSLFLDCFVSLQGGTIQKDGVDLIFWVQR